MPVLNGYLTGAGTLRAMLRTVGSLALAVLTVVPIAACSEAGSATPTTEVALTSLPPASVTSEAPATSTTTTTSTTISSSAAALGLPEYSVVARVEDPSGDTLVILLDTSTYTTLSDIDLENVIADVYERFAPVVEIHVVDSQAAAQLVLADEVTDEQSVVLDDHYLVRLEEGFRIIYLGPFGSLANSILGS